MLVIRLNSVVHFECLLWICSVQLSAWFFHDLLMMDWVGTHMERNAGLHFISSMVRRRIQEILWNGLEGGVISVSPSSILTTALIDGLC